MFYNEIRELSQKYLDRAMKLREDIHRHPETSYEEFHTAARIMEELDKAGISYTPQIGGYTGIAGTIQGGKPGKTILIRADMDALNITEEVDVPYKSEIPGKMHACGHDGNTGILLGTLLVLNELKEELPGLIKFVFQPAEEGGGGAIPTIMESGILENPKVEAAFACHVAGELPEGIIKYKYGPIMAAPDAFELTIKGNGGHGAAPQNGIDPIVLTAQVIMACQTIISRRTPPMEPAVLTFGSVEGGSAHNIIPNEVHLTGTVRTFDKDLREAIPAQMDALIKGITQGQGGDYVFTYEKSYPAFYNDDAIMAGIEETLRGFFGEEHLLEEKVVNMGGEDFAFVAEAVPTGYFNIGVGKKCPTEEIKHHHPRFSFESKNLIYGIEAMSAVVTDYLLRHAE